MKRRAEALVVLAGLLVWGCSVVAQSIDQETMLVKASVLTKLAGYVESAVRYKGAPEALNEPELLRFSTQHDPDILDAFRGYAVRVRRSGNNSSVLLCTADRSVALIEDAGCTAKSDAHLWERIPNVACEFQLKLEEVCGTQ
jgi:hypothetical protein